MGWEATPKERKQHRDRMKERAKELFCPNKECEVHGIKNIGNIFFVRRYGSGETQNLFRCNQCHKTFSERRETPLFNLHLPEDKLLQIVQAIVEGNGVRASARIVGVGKNTVSNVVKVCGRHTKVMHDYFARNLHIDECQLDEFWSFIKKNKKI